MSSCHLKQSQYITYNISQEYHNITATWRRNCGVAPKTATMSAACWGHCLSGVFSEGSPASVPFMVPSQNNPHVGFIGIPWCVQMCVVDVWANHSKSTINTILLGGIRGTYRKEHLPVQEQKEWTNYIDYTWSSVGDRSCAAGCTPSMRTAHNCTTSKIQCFWMSSCDVQTDLPSGHQSWLAGKSPIDTWFSQVENSICGGFSSQPR